MYSQQFKIWTHKHGNIGHKDSNILKKLSHNQGEYLKIQAKVKFLLYFGESLIFVSLHSSEHPPQYWWYPSTVLSTHHITDGIPL